MNIWAWVTFPQAVILNLYAEKFYGDFFNDFRSFLQDCLFLLKFFFLPLMLSEVFHDKLRDEGRNAEFKEIDIAKWH